MLIKLIAIGKVKEKNLATRCNEYIQRLGAFGKYEQIELGDSNPTNEGKAICKELDKEHNSCVIVLSEEGKEFTSVDFSGYLQKIDKKVIFVIGGPFGLAEEVKRRANLLWSLSKLTFPHEVARLICLEQIYRAGNIARGGKYHHV